MSFSLSEDIFLVHLIARTFLYNFIWKALIFPRLVAFSVHQMCINCVYWLNKYVEDWEFLLKTDCFTPPDMVVRFHSSGSERFSSLRVLNMSRIYFAPPIYQHLSLGFIFKSLFCIREFYKRMIKNFLLQELNFITKQAKIHSRAQGREWYIFRTKEKSMDLLKPVKIYHL